MKEKNYTMPGMNRTWTIFSHLKTEKKSLNVKHCCVLCKNERLNTVQASKQFIANMLVNIK